MPTDIQAWINFLSIGTNVTVIVMVFRVSKYLGKLELQIELLWADYVARKQTRSHSRD